MADAKANHIAERENADRREECKGENAGVLDSTFEARVKMPIAPENAAARLPGVSLPTLPGPTAVLVVVAWFSLVGRLPHWG